MTVELIDNETKGGVLDLTDGKDTEDKDSLDTEGSPSTEEDSPKPDGEETETTDGEETEVKEGEEEGADKPEYFMGEEQVDVEVPDEVANALTEAGVDKDELLAQLFKKDGDFSLDEATKTKLEEKFGKTLVDGYLGMYKGLNEQTLAKSASDKESKNATEAEQGKAYSEAVGGEDGLNKMEGYLVDNFNESQVSAYNAVMENGDHDSQMLIISQVQKQMEMADRLENGDKKINLIGDKDAANSGVSSPMDKGYLSSAEYDTIMNDPSDDKYWTDSAYMSKVDSARKAGLRSNK